MKHYKHLIVALAGLLSIASSAKSDTVSSAQGDLILAFRITDSTDILGGISGNGTKNLEIDLGSGGTALSSNFTLSLGTDLTALYGSSWNTASTLVWSVSGDTATKTLWATSPNGTVWLRRTSTLQNSAATKITPLYSDLNGQTTTGTGINGAIIDASTDTSSYTAKVGTNGNYGYTYFSGGIEAGVSSTGATSADIYYLPYVASGSTPGTDKGTFSLASDGTLTFLAVPEPSTYALASIGLFSLVVMARRRRALANA